MKGHVYIIYNDVTEESIPAVFNDDKVANKFCNFMNQCGHVGKYRVLNMKTYNSIKEYVAENKDKYLVYLNEIQKEKGTLQKEDIDDLLSK